MSDDPLAAGNREWFEAEEQARIRQIELAAEAALVAAQPTLDDLARERLATARQHLARFLTAMATGGNPGLRRWKWQKSMFRTFVRWHLKEGGRFRGTEAWNIDGMWITPDGRFGLDGSWVNADAYLWRMLKMIETWGHPGYGEESTKLDAPLFDSRTAQFGMTLGNFLAAHGIKL
jgi:hypothetical protein